MYVFCKYKQQLKDYYFVVAAQHLVSVTDTQKFSSESNDNSVKIRLYETLIMKAMAATIPMEAIIKAMEDLIKKKYTHWAIIIVKKAIVVSTGTAPKNL